MHFLRSSRHSPATSYRRRKAVACGGFIHTSFLSPIETWVAAMSTRQARLRGSSGCFKARLYHASVPPVSTNEHVKLAFFRASTSGDRRGPHGRGHWTASCSRNADAS